MGNSYRERNGRKSGNFWPDCNFLSKQLEQGLRELKISPKRKSNFPYHSGNQQSGWGIEPEFFFSNTQFYMLLLFCLKPGGVAGGGSTQLKQYKHLCLEEKKKRYWL